MKTLQNTPKKVREHLFEEIANGTIIPTPGQEWELFITRYYNASRYYATAPASMSGDMVATGIHYQIKSANGFWEGITNLSEFTDYIENTCKASRYILKVGTNSKITGKVWWLDVDKQELIALAQAGHIKFNRKAHGKPAAKWSMTYKEALHLNMKMGISPVKY
jgi:hypothetical protein